MSIRYKDQIIAGSGGACIGIPPGGDTGQVLTKKSAQDGDVDWENGREIYSTNETRIGTWIDGKPLYRRVYTGTTPQAQVSQAVITIPIDIDIISMFGMVDGHFVLPNYGSDKSFIVIWRATSDKSKIYMLPGASDYANKPYAVIIQYTKTTDQATISMPASASFPQETLEGTVETPRFDFSTAATASDIR